MFAHIGHYKHPGRFQSHIGVPAAKPKFHAFIGMPRPLYAMGSSTSIGDQPHEYYYPNQLDLETRGRFYDQLTPGPQKS